MTKPLQRPACLRRRILAAPLILAATLALPARAEPAQAVRIPAGSLDAALITLARQTHQQLLYSPQIVAGRRAPAVSGQLTVEQALTRLLAGADIEVTRAAPEVLVLRPRGAPASQRPSEATPGDPARPFVADPAPDAPVEGSAPAATATPAPAAPATLSELQVTGSHIRGARNAAPLLVMDRDALDRSGRATLAEALSVLPQNFAGVASEGTVATGADRVGRNAAFATAINLRGLGPDATLVLVNGRRMAGSGLFGDFSDVSAIPSAAVSRVEVLLDGASAVYGADAVGGVVNIILRRDVEGAETRALAGVGTRGEPFQAQLSQTFGHRWDTGNVLFVYEYQQRDRLPSASRDFAATADLRPLGGHDQRTTSGFPGNILDPATFNPRWGIPPGQTGVNLRPQDLRDGVLNPGDPRPGSDLLPRQTLQAVYLAANQSLGDRFEISADARYGFRRYDARVAPATTTLEVSRANPFYVSPTPDTSELIAYSFEGQARNPSAGGNAESLGLTLGGTLKLAGDWRAEGYLAFAQEIEETYDRALLNDANLDEALGNVPDRASTGFRASRDGYFNPFIGIPTGNSPQVLAFVLGGFSKTRTRDQVSSANLQADGTLLQLAGGPLKLALGGQVRRETLVQAGSNYISTVAPVPQQGTDVSRQVLAGFAELRAPLFGPGNARPGLQRLELSLAGRVERYDDVGTTANPQVGLVWAPAEDLVFRATYGRSFRAPALRELSTPPFNSSALFPLGTTRIRGLLLGGGNPDLDPETAKSWTLGADFTPRRWPGLRLSVTGFDVTFSDRIDKPVTANALRALSDPTLTSFVSRISPATNAADRARLVALLASPGTTASAAAFAPEVYGAIVDNRYVNTTTLEVRGVDLSGGYSFDLHGDTIALAGNASYLLDYKQQLTPTSAVIDRVGIANFPVKLRGRLSADWTRDLYSAGLAFNYVGAYHDALGARIASQPTFDLQLRKAAAPDGPLRGVAATLNVRNLFDRDPPFYDNTIGVGYDPANADPIGRFVSLQLTRSW